jgi:hypothetical protein
MTTAVVGIDLSLTATGVAFANGSTALWRPKARGVERLAWFRDTIGGGYDSDGEIDLVVLEDYAYHGRLAHSHELGELGGVVRLALHDAGIPFVAVVPSALKRYATGRGNASKDEMKAAARARLGFVGEDDNEADALWLRAMGCDGLGSPVVALPKANRDALAKVAWGREAVSA